MQTQVDRAQHHGPEGTGAQSTGLPQASRLRSWWMVPVAITFVGLIARFFLLDNQSLWGDEGYTWYAIKDSLWLCLEQIRNEGSQGPLYFVLQWLWRQAFGTTELGLRSFPAIAGTLGIVSVWLIGFRLAGHRAANIAAALAAISPLWVYYSQETRPYILSVTLVAGAVACAQRMVENDKVRWGWLIGYVLCASGAVLTHYFAFFALLAIALLLWKNMRALTVWLSASVLAAILPLTWVIWGWTTFLSTLGSDVPKGLDWGTYLWGLAEAFSKGLPSPSGLPAIFVLIGLGLALLGAFKRQSIPLVGWLVIAVAGIQLLGFPADRPGPWVRYIISALPAFILLAAIGIERLWKRQALVGMIALAAMLGISAISLWQVYFDPALARFDFRTPIAQLTASIRPEDKVIINRGNPAFNYYYGNTSPEPIDIIQYAGTPDHEIQKQLTEATTAARIVYLVKYMPPEFDPSNTIEGWLDSHGTKMNDQWVEHIRVVTYDFRPTPKLEDSEARKVEATFGDAIQLAGWTIDPDTRAGDLARVTLFWQADASVLIDYKVFVHLVDAQNPEHKVAQHDSVPAMGTMPPTQWQQGEVVTDSHPLIVPAGNWQLSIGLYDPNTGERLVARAPGQPDDSRLLLGPIEVR